MALFDEACLRLVVLAAGDFFPAFFTAFPAAFLTGFLAAFFAAFFGGLRINNLLDLQYGFRKATTILLPFRSEFFEIPLCIVNAPRGDFLSPAGNVSFRQ